MAIVVTTLGRARPREHPPPSNRPHHSADKLPRASSSTAVGYRPFSNRGLSSQAPQTASVASLPIPYAGNRRHHHAASGMEHPPPRIVVTTRGRQAASGASSSNAIVVTTPGCSHPGEHPPPRIVVTTIEQSSMEHPPPTSPSSDGPSGSCPRQYRTLVVAGSSLTGSVLSAEEPYVLTCCNGRRVPVLVIT